MLLKNIFKYLQYSKSFAHFTARKKPTFMKTKTHNEMLINVLDKIEKHPKDWNVIRQDLLKDNALTESKVDSLILEHFVNKQKYSLGYSYISFLRGEKIKCNHIVTGKCLNLIYLINKENYFMVHKPISNEYEELILELFSEIRKNEVLDSISLEYLIFALSLTKEWKKCLKLLQEIKITTTPASKAYCCTISAAFLNKDDALGWSLLNEIAQLDRSIENIVYFAYINFLKQLNATQNCFILLDKLFNFLQEYDIVLGYPEVLKISEYTKEIKLSTSTHSVYPKGLCSSCNKYLQKISLNENEFSELKSAIIKNVIIGKDIFTKTDPREIERFKEFVDKEQKFDVVLDGLNVAFSAGTKHSPQVFSALVASVVEHFVKNNKKVLVVGRYHMTKWPKQNWNYITQNSTVFLTANISQDDPYLLYCALNSGKNTVIVTRDLMRSHKFLLKSTKLKILFKRWLTQQQYQLLKVSGDGTPIFKNPLPYTISAQKNEGVWHIPFKNPNNPDQIHWLCIRS